MYRLPGLSKKAAAVVVGLAEEEFPDWTRGVGRPKALTLVEALRLTLCRLRRNATYNDLHEDFAIGTTTAWDYHQVAAGSGLGQGAVPVRVKRSGLRRVGSRRS